MDGKKHFFVTVNTQDIREMSLPEGGIEYEIVANGNEVEEIAKLFRAQNHETFGALGFLGKPFDEWGVDDKRAAFDMELIKLYRRIFDLGTEKTRSQIREMGILDK